MSVCYVFESVFIDSVDVAYIAVCEHPECLLTHQSECRSAGMDVDMLSVWFVPVSDAL